MLGSILDALDEYHTSTVRHPYVETWLTDCNYDAEKIVEKL
jgi:hypothetical protein